MEGNLLRIYRTQRSVRIKYLTARNIIVLSLHYRLRFLYLSVVFSFTVFFLYLYCISSDSLYLILLKLLWRNVSKIQVFGKS